MGYYQGDYYRGDYYRGDPGILGFLGKAFKTVGGAAASLIPGVGPLASKLIAKIPTPVRTVVSAGAQSIIKHPVLSGAAAAGVVGAGAVLTAPSGGAMTMPGGAVFQLPSGTAMTPGAMGMGVRLSRTGRRIRYSLRTGKAIRRMRVTNPKALRKAIRRAKGFEKLARRVMHFSSPRKVHGRAIFKTRRRKK